MGIINRPLLVSDSSSPSLKSTVGNGTGLKLKIKLNKPPTPIPSSTNANSTSTLNLTSTSASASASPSTSTASTPHMLIKIPNTFAPLISISPSPSLSSSPLPIPSATPTSGLKIRIKAPTSTSPISAPSLPSVPGSFKEHKRKIGLSIPLPEIGTLPKRRKTNAIKKMKRYLADSDEEDFSEEQIDYDDSNSDLDASTSFKSKRYKITEDAYDSKDDIHPKTNRESIKNTVTVSSNGVNAHLTHPTTDSEVSPISTPTLATSTPTPTPTPTPIPIPASTPASTSPPNSVAEMTSASKQSTFSVRKIMNTVLSQLIKKDSYGIFFDPVKEGDAPGYHNIIKQPMDFTTLKKNLASSVYTTIDHFKSEVDLIWSNCMTFNGPDTIYYKEAARLKQEANNLFRKYKQKVPTSASISTSKSKQVLQSTESEEVLDIIGTGDSEIDKTSSQIRKQTSSTSTNSTPLTPLTGNLHKDKESKRKQTGASSSASRRAKPLSSSGTPVTSTGVHTPAGTTRRVASTSTPISTSKLQRSATTVMPSSSSVRIPPPIPNLTGVANQAQYSMYIGKSPAKASTPATPASTPTATTIASSASSQPQVGVTPTSTGSLGVSSSSLPATATGLVKPAENFNHYSNFVSNYINYRTKTPTTSTPTTNSNTTTNAASLQRSVGISGVLPSFTEHSYAASLENFVKFMDSSAGESVAKFIRNLRAAQQLQQQKQTSTSASTPSSTSQPPESRSNSASAQHLASADTTPTSTAFNSNGTVKSFSIDPEEKLELDPSSLRELANSLSKDGYDVSFLLHIYQNSTENSSALDFIDSMSISNINDNAANVTGQTNNAGDIAVQAQLDHNFQLLYLLQVSQSERASDTLSEQEQRIASQLSKSLIELADRLPPAALDSHFTASLRDTLLH